MLPSSADRVADQTAPQVLQCIRERTERSIRYYSAYPHEIPERLRELDREWDVERALETGSASLTLLGLVLGSTVSRKWYWLSFGVQGFFLQHALQGWCPPLPVFRRLGVRTAQEIEAERCALQAILANAGGSARTGDRTASFVPSGS
jgi:hypothetical protein